MRAHLINISFPCFQDGRSVGLYDGVECVCVGVLRLYYILRATPYFVHSPENDDDVELLIY